MSVVKGLWYYTWERKQTVNGEKMWNVHLCLLWFHAIILSCIWFDNYGNVDYRHHRMGGGGRAFCVLLSAITIFPMGNIGLIFPQGKYLVILPPPPPPPHPNIGWVLFMQSTPALKTAQIPVCLESAIGRKILSSPPTPLPPTPQCVLELVDWCVHVQCVCVCGVCVCACVVYVFVYVCVCVCACVVCVFVWVWCRSCCLASCGLNCL